VSDPRLCIIGAGGLSSFRIYPYIGLAGAQLVGACDLDAEKVERNTRRFGGTPYTDLNEMLDAEKPDGVIICIGPTQHAELTEFVKAIQEGRSTRSAIYESYKSMVLFEAIQGSAESGKVVDSAFESP